MRRQKTAAIAVLAAVIFITGAQPTQTVLAVGKNTIDVAALRGTALKRSAAYEKVENKLELAQAKYVQSVKKLRLKEENQRSFRWSPLLNFKLPEKPNLSDEYDYNYTPLALQSEIDQLEHERGDTVYAVYEAVELNFVEAYRLQEMIAFNEERLSAADKNLQKNRARLAVGQAKESDIAAMEQKIGRLEKTIASDMRSLSAVKDKLYEQTGLNLTFYTLTSPYVDANLDREMQDLLIEYTLDNSDTYYKAQCAAANALLALNTNYDLMRKQYGAANMSLIDSYVNQAKNGEKLETREFKSAYNRLLTAVDAPWTGSFKILFIRIPKVWLKGAIDGVRYVEDEPLALYESAIEYQNARAEEEAVKQELVRLVKDTFENYVSARNACIDTKESIAQKKEEIEKSAALNIIGQMTFEEYQEVEEEYESLQVDYLQAQADYSGILYTFNRLTCGRIRDFLTAGSMERKAGMGGVSYVVPEEGEGICYYIRMLASGTAFEMGLDVPEDYDGIPVTDFELWIRQEAELIQVGGRIPVEERLRHLQLDIASVERVLIRLYNGSEFIDDCDIDPSEYSGRLNIVTGYRIEKNEGDQLGSYAVETTESGLAFITITPEASEGIAGYCIMDAEGVSLLDGSVVPIKEAFRYLAAVAGDLEELTIHFYDAEGMPLTRARFQTSDSTIRKISENDGNGAKVHGEKKKRKTETEQEERADGGHVSGGDSACSENAPSGGGE